MCQKLIKSRLNVQRQLHHENGQGIVHTFLKEYPKELTVALEKARL